MAAQTSNKPVGLMITAIFFALMTVVFAIVAYSFNQSYKLAQADVLSKSTEIANLKKISGDANKDVESLKTMVGLKLSTVESTDPQDPATVSGSVKAELAKAGPNAGLDLVTTLNKVSQVYSSTEQDRSSIAKNLDVQNKEVLALQKRYEEIANQHDEARRKSEADLRDLERNRDELLSAKDREINDWRKRFNDSQEELQRQTEILKAERKKSADEVARLEGINDKLRDDLDELKQQTFEVADGLIRRVEHDIKRVYINLGSADHVRERMTFSVYDRDNSAIGRGQSEIKGMIEVTKVIDAHLAEAIIVHEELKRPMTAGDQIYTPLWSPGRMEYFSIIGFIDIDNDGRDDRELLRQILEIAGAGIDNEVDEKGNRTGKGITERTKFLIKGEVKEPADFPDKSEDRKNAVNVSMALKDLHREARLNGVRTVTLNDLLAYIGYKPKRRLYRPGQERPFNLKAGAHSTAVNEPLEKSRESSGQVSGSVLRDKNKPQAVSPGNTSQVFGTKRGY